MGKFRLSQKGIKQLLFLLPILFGCTSESQAQSLFDKINLAKNYWSDAPDATWTSNYRQQLDNLYDIIPEVTASGHNDTIGFLYYYITYRHFQLNEMKQVKENATICLHYLEKSDYDDYIIPYSHFYNAQANKLLGYREEAISDIQSIFTTNLKRRGFEIIGDAQRLLASIYRDKGDHESALSQLNYFLNSNLADSLDAYSKATLLQDLSLTYSSYQDSLSIQKAVDAIAESNRLLPYISNEFAEQTDVNISNRMQMGYIHYSNHQYDAAIQVYENTLNLIDKKTANLNFRRYYNTTLANLIELYGTVGKSEHIAALISQQQLHLPVEIALELQDSYALLNENLSTYYRHKKQYSAAQDYLTAAFKSIQTSEDQPAHQLKSNSYKQRLTKLLRAKIELNKDLHQEYKDSQYLDIALQDMYRLDSLIDYVNQELLFESSILNWRQEAKSFYNIGIEVAFTLNDEIAFWAFSEKAKSLALLDGISNDKLFLSHELITKSVQQLRELQLEESNLNQKLQSPPTLTAADSLRKEITINKNNQNTILIQRNSLLQKQIPKTIPLAETQATIDKASLIQYVVTENNTYAILVNQNKSSLHKLGASALIKHKITNFRKLLNDKDDSDSNFENISLLLQELHTLLIKPFKELNQDLIIIPEDFLLILPFESLLNDKGRYLIEDYTIHYQLSATLRNQTYKSDHDASNHTTIVSPEYSGISFSPLAHAQEEAQIVQSLTDGKQYTTISKNELITQYTTSEVFHFSGHALVNEGLQNNSFLALSDTSQLSEREIYNYPNQLNLVVLSGCDTGAGKILKGEGISNLTRAFIYAGSKTVLQSLWSIDDQSSQLLIQYFYQELKKGKTKSQALREAKLNYLTTVDDFHKHPYYWSSFVLVGDDTAITFSSSNNLHPYLIGILGFIFLFILVYYFRP